MAVFSFAASGYTVNSSLISLSGIFDYDHEQHSSSKLKVYDDSDNYTTFGGSGFSYTFRSGYLTDVKGGTVKTLDFAVDGVKVVKITDLKVSAAKLFDAAVSAATSNNSTAFVSLLVSGNDKITGTKSADVIDAGAGNDNVGGGNGNDVLKGGTGNDRLHGGMGADDLYGGSGNDTFVFKHVKESTYAASGRDTIFDFNGDGDHISLRDIDANSTKGGNQNFTFIGTKDFTKLKNGDYVAGEVRYETNKSTGTTYVYANVDKDKAPEFAIELKSFTDALHKGDFIL